MKGLGVFVYILIKFATVSWQNLTKKVQKLHDHILYIQYPFRLGAVGIFSCFTNASLFLFRPKSQIWGHMPHIVCPLSFAYMDLRVCMEGHNTGVPLYMYLLMVSTESSQIPMANLAKVA